MIWQNHLWKKQNKKIVKFYMPVDVVVADDFSDSANKKVVSMMKFQLIGKLLI